MKMMMDSSTMDNRNYININNNNMDHNDSLNDTHNDTHDNDMNNHHIRIQFQLAKEYHHYIPSLDYHDFDNFSSISLTHGGNKQYYKYPV